MHNSILILDFGSQYTQLIARRVRELGVYCEILPHNVDLDVLRARQPKGFILSGGPQSVLSPGAPVCDTQALAGMAPLLGVCYGMHLIVHQRGGQLQPGHQNEYGLASLLWDQQALKKARPSVQALAGGKKSHSSEGLSSVWMSHADSLLQVPKGFQVLARTVDTRGGPGVPAFIASLAGGGSSVWGVQFHPEVTHTQGGVKFLRAFVLDVCGAQKNWSPQERQQHLTQQVRQQVGAQDQVLCALSGGVDSSVLAVLLTQVLGRERVHCVFVDTGLLRLNEFNEVLQAYKQLKLNIKGVPAGDLFLKRLKNITDPEQKRKIIGHTFVDVFLKEAEVLGRCRLWLAQGTLYPDVIESVSPRGAQSVKIKSHHNVGGLPENLKLPLLEPFRELFKDEVRELGGELGVPQSVVGRHPFPGPGLALRVVGEVSEKSLTLLQQADHVFIRELKKHHLYDKIWQAFCVLLPVCSVGVGGDGRSYERVLALRAVTSCDGMTADWFEFESSFLRHVSNCMTNEVRGINRVVYDVTSKPPGTIEWE